MSIVNSVDEFLPTEGQSVYCDNPPYSNRDGDEYE